MTGAAYAGMTGAAYAGMTGAAYAGMTGAAYAGMTIFSSFRRKPESRLSARPSETWAPEIMRL